MTTTTLNSSRSNNCFTSAPLNPTADDDSYEELDQSPSPSLSWLVKYWSSSFFHSPSMIMDNLCACSSPKGIHEIDINTADSTSYYFDDMMHSNSIVDSMSLNPTKTSKSKSSSSSRKRRNSKKNRYRQSSIVADESNDYDGDIRMGPPPTCSSPTSMSSTDTSNLMKLNSCQSFDQYIDTTNYLCASSDAAAAAATMATPTNNSRNAAVPVTPRLQLDERRRNRRAQQQQYQLSPSPTLSAADTYTTISMSQSFANDFDYADSSDDTSFEQQQQQDMTNEGNNLYFEDRLTAEQLLTPTPTTYASTDPIPSFHTTRAIVSITTPFPYFESTTDIHNNDSGSDSRNNPFRRLRPRTTTMDFSGMADISSIHQNNNGHEDEDETKEEQDEDVDENKNPPSSVTKKQQPTTTKKLASHEDDDCGGGGLDDSAYRYLIRMSPQNYRHQSRGGVEESKVEQDYEYAAQPSRARAA